MDGMCQGLRMLSYILFLCSFCHEVGYVAICCFMARCTLWEVVCVLLRKNFLSLVSFHPDFSNMDAFSWLNGLGRI